MRRKQLNSLRISFVVLTFLLCFKARVGALMLGGAELKQQTQSQPVSGPLPRRNRDQSFWKKPLNSLNSWKNSSKNISFQFLARSVRQQQPQAGRQHDARRSQPFNALLTSVGQLADSPLRHGAHLALTASKTGSHKRLARAADDGGMGFGDIFQSIIQFVLNSIDAFMKLFSPNDGDK